MQQTEERRCRFHPRLAPEPCPYCGERYLICSPRQKHHVQSPSCQRKFDNLRRRTAPFEPHLAPEPCHQCGEEYMLLTPYQRAHKDPACQRENRRVRDGWRWIGRERKPPAEPPARPAELLTNPLAFARSQAFPSYRVIYQRFPEDTIQELRLALLEHGIRDFERPIWLDISALRRRVRRHLYWLARDLGANPRLTRNRQCEFIPEGCEERPCKDWALVWRTCAA